MRLKRGYDMIWYEDKGMQYNKYIINKYKIGFNCYISDINVFEIKSLIFNLVVFI